MPEYLTERGCKTLREHAGSLSFVQSSIVDVLPTGPAGAFDAFHLSNVGDWLTPQQFDELLRAIAERSARPARAVWRYLHCGRPVPEALGCTLRLDAALGARLQASDRFPVYRTAVAEVTG